MKQVLAAACGVALLCGDAGATDIHARISDQGMLQISATAQAGYRAFHPRARNGGLRPSAAQAGGARVRLPPAHLRPLFRQVAGESGLREPLLWAVALTESAFDPAAVSPAGAVGLMQLMPGTARRFGVDDRRDALQNLRGGAAYLSALLKRYGNDVHVALAAYNAGEGAVQRFGGRVPPYPETEAYVRSVTRYYQALSAQAGE